MRVLFAGADGPIGRHAVPLLRSAGYDVVALGAARDGDRVDTVAADPLDAGSVAAAIRRAAPDLIVQAVIPAPEFCPRPDARRRPGSRHRRLGAPGPSTTELADIINANIVTGAGDSRIICQSICSATVGREASASSGQPARTPARVSEPLTRIERRVAAADGVILRIGHLYGMGTGLAADGDTMRLIRTGRVPIVGDGSSTFSFVHLADAAAAILAAADHSFIGTLDVVDDQPATLATWLPFVADLISAPRPRTIPAWLSAMIFDPWQHHLVTGSVPASNAAARRALHWAPRHPDWRDGFAAELR